MNFMSIVLAVTAEALIAFLAILIVAALAAAAVSVMVDDDPSFFFVQLITKNEAQWSCTEKNTTTNSSHSFYICTGTVLRKGNCTENRLFVVV